MVYLYEAFLSEAPFLAWQQQERPIGSTGGRTKILRPCARHRPAWRTERGGESAKGGFGSAGVLEIVEDDTGGTYRAVYTVRFAEAIFVLHVFQKKSKRGIETPKPDMDIIRQRMKAAAIFAQELRNE